MQDQPAVPAAATPDPYATSAAQTQGDVQSAIANSIMGNADVRTPFGSSTSQQIGTYTIKDAQGNNIEVPKWMQTQTLSAAGQSQLDQQNQLASATNNLAINQVGQLGSTLGTPLTAAGLPGAVNSIGSGPNLQTSIAGAGPIQSSVNLQKSVGANDFSADRDKVEQALMSRLQAGLDRDQGSLDAKLANQGIGVGSRAYGTAQALQGQNVNDARMQSILAGGQEQSRLFGLDLQKGQFANDATLAGANFANAAQSQLFGQNADQASFGNNANQQMFSNNAMGATFANTARERALQEQIAIRNQPVNEIAALTSGNQLNVPQFSQFNGGQIAGSTVGSNIMGSAQLANQQWMQQSQAAAQNNAGIYGLGSSLLGAGGRVMAAGM